jgi:F0F1-type ATP synthase membrane subunit b/b'
MMESKMRYAIIKDHLKKQLNELEAHICLVKARVETKEIGDTAEYQKWLSELGKIRDELNKSLERMEGASGQDLEQLKMSAETSLSDMKSVINREFAGLE